MVKEHTYSDMYENLNTNYVYSFDYSVLVAYFHDSEFTCFVSKFTTFL